MITVHTGDLLTSDCTHICHQCNCLGTMGAGIAAQIRDFFPQVYTVLRTRYESGKTKLGELDIVPISDSQFVVNMYAQDKYYGGGPRRDGVLTDYLAFGACCEALRDDIVRRGLEKTARIGFPYGIGCGLARGDWNRVSFIIEDILGDLNVEFWKLEKTHG